MNIVWDLGGVLFHWRPLALLARLLPEHVTDDASARHWREAFFQGDTGDWGEFNRGKLDEPEIVRRIVARTGLSAALAQQVIDAIPTELEPIPDSHALFAELRERGHRQFYMSNMPARFAEHLESTFEAFRLFDGGMFSSRVHHVKPEQAFYRHVHETFGLDGDTLFFDDHLGNVEAARRFGWRAHAYTDAAAARAELKTLGVL